MTGFSTINTLFLYSIITMLLIMVGGLIPLVKKWDDRFIHVFMSFGSGILIGVYFIHILPHTAEMIGARVGIYSLIGFLGIFFIEKFLTVHPCEGHGCNYHTVSMTAFAGLSVHSVISGLFMGASIRVASLQSVVILAIIIHKLPESFSLSTLLKKSERFSVQRIIGLLFFFSLLVPLGAFLAYFVLESISEDFLGPIMGITGGTFIYLGASDLLPELHRHTKDRWLHLSCFVMGVLMMALSGYIE